MDMRAVCRGWRSAVADPRLHGAGDLRFCPRQWVMLEKDGHDDEGRLFVNVVSTGRFFRRHLPLLRGHVLVGASDRLLVLSEIWHPRTCIFLNPLTGHILRFAASVGTLHDSTIAVGFGGQIVLLATTGKRSESWYADPSSKQFYSRPAPHSAHHIASTVAYAGQIYMAYTDGSVSRRVGPSAQHGYDELVIAATKPADHTEIIEAVFLVESAGELLLVLRKCYVFRVFKVDVERKGLEAVTSIGGRALFLGRWCLSVAADKFPTIEGDSLYYATPLCVCPGLTMSDQRIMRIKIGGGWEWSVSSHMDHPWSIARVFFAYCFNLPGSMDALLLPS